MLVAPVLDDHRAAAPLVALETGQTLLRSLSRTHGANRSRNIDGFKDLSGLYRSNGEQVVLTTEFLLEICLHHDPNLLTQLVRAHLSVLECLADDLSRKLVSVENPIRILDPRNVLPWIEGTVIPCKHEYNVRSLLLQSGLQTKVETLALACKRKQLSLCLGHKYGSFLPINAWESGFLSAFYYTPFHTSCQAKNEQGFEPLNHGHFIAFSRFSALTPFSLSTFFKNETFPTSDLLSFSGSPLCSLANPKFLKSSR